MGGAAHSKTDVENNHECFNRRGDSLGGAANLTFPLANKFKSVSIAGAILWGVLRWIRQIGRCPDVFQSQGRFFGGCCESEALKKVFNLLVSIAGAILWGVLQSVLAHFLNKINCFNRRGDSLGGAAWCGYIT